MRVHVSCVSCGEYILFEAKLKARNHKESTPLNNIRWKKIYKSPAASSAVATAPPFDPPSLDLFFFCLFSVVSVTVSLLCRSLVSSSPLCDPAGSRAVPFTESSCTFPR